MFVGDFDVVGFGFSGEFEVGVVDVAQSGAVKFAEAAVEHEAVHDFDEEECFEAAFFEWFEVWAAAGAGEVGAEDVVDFFLAFDHAAFVVGERGEFVVFGGVEAQQRQEVVARGGVHGDAFFDEDAKFVPEGGEFDGVFFGEVEQFFEQAADEGFLDALHDLAALDHFARDVEREVFAVNDAFDEAEVFGEEVARFFLDEDFARVEFDFAFGAAVHHAAFASGGDEEDGVNVYGCFGGEVDVHHGCFEVVGELAVEFFVLLVGDVARWLPPDGGLLVDAFFAGVDGEGDVVGVAFDDLFDFPDVGEFVGVFFECEDDGGAAFVAFGGADEEGVVAVRDPLGGLGTSAVGAGDDGDFFGDDEGGVEADAELSDDAAALSAFEAFHEGTGAGLGDGAEVFDHFFFGHADAGVGDGDGFGFVIDVDVDGEFGFGVEDVVVGEHFKLGAVEGVGGVGDEFA